MKHPVALTVAGSDSGGGAGIEADLKTFAALGVHGACAITAVTAQNTVAVTGVQEIDTELIEKQIRAVADDIGVDAAKTGMLSSSGIISCVARYIGSHPVPLVVDPVMVSKSGAKLLRDDAIRNLQEELLPLATVVTPNIPEAEALTGVKITQVREVREAARVLVERFGPKACVVKGGHLTGERCVDVLYVNGSFEELESPRVATKNTHGTGCVFSAAIAAELAKGSGVIQSVRTAKAFVTNAIIHSLGLGRGAGPVDPSSWLEIERERLLVLNKLKEALEVLESSPAVRRLVPEVRINLVMSLPARYAKGVSDVAGVPGRITDVGDRVRAAAPPAFGASSHVARAVLKVMEHDDRVRAAADIRFSDEILTAIRRLGLLVSSYDRKDEPPSVKKREGSTIQWGVEQAIKKVGRVPDIICDPGGMGKEPIIKVLGRDAAEVAKTMVKIADGLR